MALDKARISPSQLYFMMLAFMAGSAALLIPGRAAGHDQWLTSLLSMAEGLPVALLYTGLALRLRDKTMIEAAPEVLGRWSGKVAAALFVGYIAHLGSLVLSDYTGFVTSVILPKTPPAIVAIILVVVCAFAVRGGLEVIARCSVVLVPVILTIVLFDSVLMLNTAKLSRLLPVMDVPPSAFLASAHAIASFPLNETVAFAAIIPFVAGRQHTKYLTVTSAIASGAAMIAFTAARVYAVIGPEAGTATYPLYSAVSMINVGQILTRFEVAVFVNVLTMGFIKITVLLYGVSVGISQLLGLRDYRPLVIPLAILMAVVSLFNFPSSIENIIFTERTYPVYAPFFQVGFPLLMLLFSWARGAPRPDPGGSSRKRA